MTLSPMISDAEIAALRHAARHRDFVATVAPHNISVEPIQLRSGKWRAYLRSFVTPWSPRGQEAETKEVVRDMFDNILSGDTREQLLSKLRSEYPGWKWLI